MLIIINTVYWDESLRNFYGNNNGDIMVQLPTMGIYSDIRTYS